MDEGFKLCVSRISCADLTNGKINRCIHPAHATQFFFLKLFHGNRLSPNGYHDIVGDVEM